MNVLPNLDAETSVHLRVISGDNVNLPNWKQNLLQKIPPARRDFPNVLEYYKKKKKKKTLKKMRDMVDVLGGWDSENSVEENAIFMPFWFFNKILKQAIFPFE